jgi:transposase InsO family protein
VRQPTDNARLERFNRTIQEKLISQGNAYTDPVRFNRRLTEWLIEHDFHRPHAALGYKTPIEVPQATKKRYRFMHHVHLLVGVISTRYNLTPF